MADMKIGRGRGRGRASGAVRGGAAPAGGTERGEGSRAARRGGVKRASAPPKRARASASNPSGSFERSGARKVRKIDAAPRKLRRDRSDEIEEIFDLVPWLMRRPDALDRELTRAAKTGRVKAVEKAVAAGAILGAPPGQTYIYGSAALRAALLAGHDAVVTYLLDRGVHPAGEADINVGNAMVALIQSGRDDGEMAKRLLEHGSAREIVEGLRRRQSGLSEAMFERRPKILRAILESGEVDLEEIKRTLYYACLSSAPSMVAILLEYVPEPRPTHYVHPGNLSDPTQHFISAAVSGSSRRSPEEHEASVRILLEAGFDPNVKDAHGFTPLMWAAKLDPRETNILRLLLEAGADPSAETRLWNGTVVSPLTRARESGFQANIEAIEDAIRRREGVLLVS